MKNTPLYDSPAGGDFLSFWRIFGIFDPQVTTFERARIKKDLKNVFRSYFYPLKHVLRQFFKSDLSERSVIIIVFAIIHIRLVESSTFAEIDFKKTVR